MDQVLTKFVLTNKQTLMLYSMQRSIAFYDVVNEPSEEKKKQKLNWIGRWGELIISSLESISEEGEDADFYNAKDLFQCLEKENEDLKGNKIPLYLMLLEAVLFRPYFPLSEKESNDLKADEEKINYFCKLFAGSMGIDKSYVKRFYDSYVKALKGISGKGKGVLTGALLGSIALSIVAGLFAPVIAPLIVKVGALTGAAASSFALATLGGGALAAGGFGIAGGIAVIVGGGAIFGAGIGGSTASLAIDMLSTPNFALSQAAKLEVVIKEIVLGAQKDVRFAQEIMMQHKKSIDALEKELIRMKMKAEANAQKISDIETALKYYKKAHERAMALY